MPKSSATPSRDPLVAAQRAFTRWRGEGSPGRRIPAALWAKAAAAARTHGVSRTATTLGLNYGRLKEQCDATPRRPARGARSVPRRAAPVAAPAAPPPFVELPALPAPTPPACRIEVHEPRGRRIAVELGAPAVAELPAVLAALGVARPRRASGRP